MSRRRLTPFVLVAVLLLGSGLGIGLGLSEAPGFRAVSVAPVVRSATRGPMSAKAATSVNLSELPRCDATARICRQLGSTLALLDAAVVGGRFVKPVTFGGLTIEPVPARKATAPLGLDLAEARAYVGYTGGMQAVPPDPGPTVGFGLVSVHGVSGRDGTPTLAKTPAWVGVVIGVNNVSCALEIPATPPPVWPRYQPEDRVVVFYGQEGRGAVLYDTGGSPECPGQSELPPSLAVAYAFVPVPWQQQGPAGLSPTVTYQAPECATLRGVSANGNANTGLFTVTVGVSFPFDRTNCDAVQTFTASVFLYPSNAGPGAPPPPNSVTLVPSSAPGAVPPALVGPIPG